MHSIQIKRPPNYLDGHSQVRPTIISGPGANILQNSSIVATTSTNQPSNPLTSGSAAARYGARNVSLNAHSMIAPLQDNQPFHRNSIGSGGALINNGGMLH